MNLIDLFRINFTARANVPAIHFEGRTLTFGELDAQSNRVARAFQRLGLQKGDRVAFYLNNSVELILAYLANLKLGLVTVPMNTQYRDTEIVHIVNDSAPRLILTDRTQIPILEPIRPELPTVERVVLADEIEASETAAIETRVDGDDLAAIMYTSGTTGRSKGAMLTHGNFVSNITGIVSAWHWTADDTLLLALPLFHTHGLGVALHGALTTGSTVVLHRAFRVSAVLDELLRGSITLFMGVPTMYVRLIEEAKQRGLDRAQLANMRLFISGSAPLSVEAFQTFEKMFGHRILERYGMTETVMNLSNLYAGPRIPGTVGVPLPGVSARVGDEHGNVIPDGEIGEVLIHGSNVFRGYWHAPEKTAEAFLHDAVGERWFRTGDLGKRDSATGFFTLVGRKHDLIISGGFNIYPREVEELLLQHSAVLEAAVVGASDSARGEIPVAFVVLREGKTASGEEVVEYCAAHLARYKVPWRVTFLDALPRNAMGKVEKKRLGN
ncbi:MAG: AMP-binding protein [Chloroflexi bacterium]|nr:AMP-binding protein [Chloroflexota bacterium]